MINKQRTNLSSRLLREHETVCAMISIFCVKHHGKKNICDACQELVEYSLERLEKCPFKEDKPTCAKCLVHCYKSVMRERIREVMKFSGPRMLHRHPIMAIRHLLDGKKKKN